MKQWSKLDVRIALIPIFFENVEKVCRNLKTIEKV
jgi:hypothetical protein